MLEIFTHLLLSFLPLGLGLIVNMFEQGLQRIWGIIEIPKSRPEEITELEEAILNFFQPADQTRMEEVIHEIAAESDVISSEGKIAKEGNKLKISHEDDLLPPNRAPYEIGVPPLDPQFCDLHLIPIVGKRIEISIDNDTSDENDVVPPNIAPDEVLSAPFIGKEMGVIDRRTPNQEKLYTNDERMELENKIRLLKANDEEDSLGDCILYCSQFPADYDFTKDTVVWSWIAAGAIQSDENDEMETIAIRCFDRLMMLEFILPSGHDRLCDQMIYKLGKDKNALPGNKNQGHKYRKSLESDADFPEIEHLSLISEGINQLNLENLRKCINLKTLLLHKCCGSEIENLLNGIFLKLKLLTLIDLSCTNVVELPSSVENLTALEYLDMSQTPIRFLPESIGSLGNLETLKLLGCRSLFGLPRGICKLIKLQHFELDIQSMPIGMGNLTNLRTLRKFVVGRKDGNGIGELRNMNKLKGSLRIEKLENILNKEEAGKALLRDKQNLTKLELLWSDLEDDKVTIEEQILENLQPPSGLQELRITFYSGGVLPSWISDPSFNQLVNITLSGCRYCELLPTFGQLPSLKILRVYGMDSVVAIEFSFCRKQKIDHQHAFPRLEKLSLDGMSNLEKWTGVEDGDFPCLVQLVIKDCPKLASLPFPSHWIARMNLEISNCKCLMESQIKN